MCADDQTPDYRIFAGGVVYFHNWPGVIVPIDLALTGFFYRGIDNFCMCFECKLEVDKLKDGAPPLNDHLEYSPNRSNAKLINFLKVCIEEEVLWGVSNIKQERLLLLYYVNSAFNFCGFNFHHIYV